MAKTRIDYSAKNISDTKSDDVNGNSRWFKLDELEKKYGNAEV